MTTITAKKIRQQSQEILYLLHASWSCSTYETKLFFQLPIEHHVKKAL